MPYLLEKCRFGYDIFAQRIIIFFSFMNDPVSTWMCLEIENARDMTIWVETYKNETEGFKCVAPNSKMSLLLSEKMKALLTEFNAPMVPYIGCTKSFHECNWKAPTEWEMYCTGYILSFTWLVSMHRQTNHCTSYFQNCHAKIDSYAPS